MIKILILEDEPQLHDRIAFILESIPGVVLKQASGRAEAEAILSVADHDIALLIIDYRQAPLATLTELQKKAKGIDCIFSLEDLKSELPPLGWSVYATIKRSDIPDTLPGKVESWRAEQVETGDNAGLGSGYCRIKTKLLLDVSPLYSDIYVKLSESKYIKVLNQGDIFDEEDLKKYADQKKLDYMYLLKESSHEFVQKYVLFIKQLIKASKPIPINELAFMHTSVQESVQELTNKLGFTAEVQELARTQIELTVKSMGKSPSLKNMLRLLEGQKGKYLADHSFLTGYIACAIASQMEWSSKSTFTKLTLAAFMHDIVLTETLAACETIAEAQALSPTETELREFSRHPYRVAEMVRSMIEVPPDVDAIIFQHHEAPNGGGFPRGITSNHISPLSAVFIVSHDLAKAYLKEQESFSIDGFLKSVQSKYSQNGFRKILSAAANLAL
ncbi:MAG: HD domain-containing protein [Bdellovibrionales bacterium]|nr:HD domain-containing protein [Oligoflexia bacterium]